MDFAQFSDFAQARGCRQVQDDAFGIYRGYPFAVHYKKGGKGQLTATFKFGAKAPKSLLKEMRAALKPYGAAPMSYAPDRMGFLLSGKDGVDENFDGALSALAELFAAAGVTPPAACPFCKGQGCDTLAFVGGGYVPVHRTCLDRVLGGSAAAARHSMQQGNYFTGILGALVGGLVGALPSLLTIWFASRVFALLFALIPICAYQGYKICRGKLNRVATVVTILSSILPVFALEQILFYLSVVDYYGIWPSIFSSMVLYFQIYTLGDMLASMITELVFVALGIWISWRMITQTGGAALQGVQYVSATTAPYAGPGVAPASVQPPAPQAAPGVIPTEAPLPEEDPCEWKG